MRSSAAISSSRLTVRVSDSLDRLVVGADDLPAWRVRAMLEGELPEIRVSASAEGAVIPIGDSGEVITLLNDRAVWTEEARQAALIRAGVRSRHGLLLQRIAQVAETSLEDLSNELGGEDAIDGLDPHQIRNVAVLADPACYGLCLFDEQGAGKTVSVIYALDLLVERDDVDVAVILSPKNMIGEWARDIERFKSGLYEVQTVSGTRREKLDALSSRADIYISNFETALSLEAELKAILRRRQPRTLLVVDESFFVKNADAGRTRAVKRIREWAGRAFVLCGTPAPNSPHDLVEQVSLADLGVAFDGAQVPDDRASALPVVQTVLENRGAYLRSLKQDVLPELPGKSFQIVELSLEAEQRLAYDAARSDLVADLRATNDAQFQQRITSFMARRSALTQICSNPRALIPGYTEIPAKLRALDRLLPGLIADGDEKVVVWSFYRASLEAIAIRYEHLGLVRVDGSVSDAGERREAVRRFQEDPETRVFLGNPAAAGAGLTLHAARYAIYESYSNQAAHFLQSLDRIHRRGQERSVEYFVLLCSGTIEEPEFARLRDKEQQAQALLGDQIAAPPTRNSMLADLDANASPEAGAGTP